MRLAPSAPNWLKRAHETVETLLTLSPTSSKRVSEALIKRAWNDVCSGQLNQNFLLMVGLPAEVTEEDLFPLVKRV